MIRFDKIKEEFYIDTLIRFDENHLVFKKELATGFADLIPLDQKQMYIDIEKTNTKYAIENIRKTRAKAKAEAELLKEFNASSLGLYLATLTTLQAGKAQKVLEKQFRYNGITRTRYENCDYKLSLGFKPVYLKGEYMLTTTENGVYNSITKTEYDYCSYIINKGL